MRWGGAIVVVALYALRAAAEPPLEPLAAAAGADQGVYAEAEDGTILVAQAAARAVHPASVTKVATSLALVERLGTDHRFETRLVATGPVADGRLRGDLVVQASNDPFFVDESASLLLRRLATLGVRTVDGRLRVRGRLLFDWQPDPDGARLARTLAGKDGAAARASLGEPASLTASALRFAGKTGTGGGAETTLATLRSPPLLHVLKALNGYSNNVFHFASDAIGGPPTVESVARAHVPPELRDEIVIDNGAGAGTTNRLSPRAAVTLLRALVRALAAAGHAPSDLMPVSGVDPGTLERRLPDRPRLVVGKTGTFGSVGASALAGLLRTQRYGVVAFAVLNHGVAVPAARARQDAFVRALADATDAEPWPYAVAARPAYDESTVE
jgi:D-alanyl-D-alanine carboxypeptidase